MIATSHVFVLGASILPFSTIFLLGFRIVPTVWYFLYFIHFGFEVLYSPEKLSMLLWVVINTITSVVVLL